MRTILIAQAHTFALYHERGAREHLTHTNDRSIRLGDGGLEQWGWPFAQEETKKQLPRIYEITTYPPPGASK